MLVLTRKIGEAVLIGDGTDRCRVVVVDISRSGVRLGIEAPRSVPDRGRFTPGTKGTAIMRAIDEKVLVLIPGSYSNFAFCGIVGECVGAHVWRLEQASMVLNSGNGPDWMALARGENRSEARFSACPEGAADVGPQFGGVFPWVGELP